MGLTAVKIRNSRSVVCLNEGCCQFRVHHLQDDSASPMPVEQRLQDAGRNRRIGRILDEVPFTVGPRTGQRYCKPTVSLAPGWTSESRGCPSWKKRSPTTFHPALIVIMNKQGFDFGLLTVKTRPHT